MGFSKPVLRAYGSYDPNVASDEAGLECLDPSLAIQSQKDDADINTIVRNFGITGKMPENVRIPTYGDFEFVGSYQDALHAVREADASFMQLPADVRSRFENNPQNFLDFVSNPDNAEEMRMLGLANKPVVPEVIPVRVIADAPPTG